MLAGAEIKPEFCVGAQIEIENTKRAFEFYVIEKCVLRVHL